MNSEKSVSINGEKHKRTHEPLIHITKRAVVPWWKAWLIRAIAVIAALIVGSILIVVLTGKNPFEIYLAMFEGTFKSQRTIWNTLQKTAILLCISLAVTPAFRMKFWNIGAEGQVLVAALASAACMFYFGDSIPGALLMVIMIIVSMLSGALWALIPAYFKAKWNTNETLFTLMMNYVAIQLVSFFIMVWVPSGSMTLSTLNVDSKNGWLPTLFGQKYFLNIAIVVVITVILYIYMKYSKQGYEIAVVGESERTAKYVGINVKKVIIRTMIISGALCGIAGWLLVAGTDHTLTTGTAGGNGFTAIMVSWLAKFNPLIMMFVSFFIAFLQKGAVQIATSCRINESIADILTGIIIFFIIGCEFFINYKINFRKKQKESKEEVQ